MTSDEPGGGDGSCSPSVTLGAGVLVAAIWTDVQARARSRTEQAALAAADAHLATLRHQVAVTRFAKAVTKAKRDALQTSIDSTMSQLATTNGDAGQHQRARVHARTSASTRCRPASGVSRARSGRSPPTTTCRRPRTSRRSRARAPSWRAAPSTGLVYPFDFPDPDGDPRRPDLLRLRHQLGGGQHSDHRLDRPLPLDRGRQRAAEPARLGLGQLHLGPGGRQHRRGLRPLLRGRRGRHGTRSASRRRPPPSPRAPSPTDPPLLSNARRHSAAPSTPRRSSTPTGRPTSCGSRGVRVHRRSGPSSSRRQARRSPPGTNPTALLAPDQPWEAGTVEAPDLVVTGGHYYLFYSGNDWNSAQLRGRRRQLHGPARPLQRRLAETDPGQRAGRRRARRGVRVRRQVGQLLDRVPRLGPRGRGIPQQPRPLSPPAHVLGPRAVGVQLGLVAPSAVTGSPGRRVAGTSACRGQRLRPPGDPRRVQVGAQLSEVARRPPPTQFVHLRRAASDRCAASPAP